MTEDEFRQLSHRLYDLESKLVGVASAVDAVVKSREARMEALAGIVSALHQAVDTLHACQEALLQARPPGRSS